jgi:uncharacterized protein involved in exopolysaccharide biosynthesis
MLNLDREVRPAFPLKQQPDQPEPSRDYRVHYRELAVRTLLTVQRQWLLVVALMALGVLLALLVIPVLPRKYSATALIFPSLYSQEQGKIVALATVDATSIVNGEARLVLSDTILQAVVKQLEPELQSEPGAGSGWLRGMFLPETRSESRFDRELATLRNNVEVTKDTRSYLIAISFTTFSAPKAAQIVNTIATEYVRDKWIQRGREAVIAAEAELTRQRAINGDKHPKVLQAADALESARADVTALMAHGDGGQSSIKADEGVKLAVPNHTPTSPRGMAILGLACLFGLLAGIGSAVWRDRRGLEPFDLAVARQLFLRMRNGWTSFDLRTWRPGKGGQADRRATNESVGAHSPTSLTPD